MQHKTHMRENTCWRKHTAPHRTNSAPACCALLRMPICHPKPQGSSCNSAPQHCTPLLAFYLHGPGRALPRPLAASKRWCPGEVYLAPPHSTRHTISKTHSHNPAPTARRFRGPSSPCAPRTPQLWGARRPTPPPSAWLLRHRPPSSLQRLPGLTPAPPHPQPAPRGEGDIRLQN